MSFGGIEGNNPGDTPDLAGTALIQIGDKLVELAGQFLALTVKIKNQRDAGADLDVAFGR